MTTLHAPRSCALLLVLTFTALGVSASCRRTETPAPMAADAPSAPTSSAIDGTPSASVAASGDTSAEAPTASVTPPHATDTPIAPASTRPKDPRLAMDGPAPRDADAARRDIIDQVRPIVESCFHAARGKQTGQRGRLRVVLRFDNKMKVDQVDVTASGSVQRQVATCTQTNVAKAKLRTAADTPRFLSFPVVLPTR